MKFTLKVLALVAFCVLVAAGAACSFKPVKYDPVEQLGYAALWQQAGWLQAACPNGDHAAAQARTLTEIAELLGAYLRHQPDPASREIFAAYERLLEDADPTGFGRAFCEEAARNLQAAAQRAMQTLGRRER